MSHPYLSPPAELLSFSGSAGTFIDPRKLYTTASPEPQAEQAMEVKMEQDDDYGFAKFAAERDALRNEQDEDSKLLMSEAGKSLSSKERRQLRNKVSARNFRERRKEYITHLESLVSKHQNEACMFKSQVDVLQNEKDELVNELSRLKISISAAIGSNKLNQAQLSNVANSGTTLTRTASSRSGTPTRERETLIPNMQKDINPYSANTNFNVDWPLSNMGSPSGGSFDFNLHNYTSVFSARPVLPTTSFSEKELLGKDDDSSYFDETQGPGDCLTAFDRVLSSILGESWSRIAPTETANVPA